jgi:hypothetical protein
VQPGHEPLLGEEHPLEQQRRRLELGDPPGLADHQRHQVLGHRVRVEVLAPLGVDLDERPGHEGVVGDVPVALVVRRDGARVLPVRVPGPDDAADAAPVPLLDRSWCPALGGAAEGVSHGGTGDHGHRPVL